MEKFSKVLAILLVLFVVSLATLYKSYGNITTALLRNVQPKSDQRHSDAVLSSPQLRQKPSDTWLSSSQPTNNDRIPSNASPLPWLHELSSTDPFRCRISEISRKCKEKKIASQSLRTTHFKYSDKSKLVMCETPKVASTTWQKILLSLQGFSKEQLDFFYNNNEIWTEQLPNKLFSKLKRERDALELVHNFTTFMITRHPFERLVSAHTDKFFDMSKPDWYRNHVGKGIAAKMAAGYLHGISLQTARLTEVKLKNSSTFRKLTLRQQNDVLQYAKILQTGSITFTQFANYIAKQPLTRTSQFDIHWRPQVNLCAPCTFNFSYVMRFENLAEESNRLLEFVQRDRPEKISFPSKRKGAIHSPETIAAFKRLPERIVSKLRLVYANDFYILGHDPYRYTGYDYE